MAIGTNQITDTLTPTTGTMNVAGTLQQNGSNIAVYPTQTGNNGKYLTTDGTNTSWATVSGTVGLGGVTRTTVLDLTNTTETYVTPSYVLPTIASEMVFKFECYIKSVSVAGTVTFRVRVGSAGTTADTEIYSDSASNSQLPVKFEGTITFDSATSIFRVVGAKVTSQVATYTAGQSPVALDEAGPYTSLTPTYLGLTAEGSTGTAGQYFQIYTANIYRLL
jgi:hypothetical protein